MFRGATRASRTPGEGARVRACAHPCHETLPAVVVCLMQSLCYQSVVPIVSTLYLCLSLADAAMPTRIATLLSAGEVRVCNFNLNLLKPRLFRQRG